MAYNNRQLFTRDFILCGLPNTNVEVYHLLPTKIWMFALLAPVLRFFGVVTCNHQNEALTCLTDETGTSNKNGAEICEYIQQDCRLKQKHRKQTLLCGFNLESQGNGYNPS